MVMEVSPSGEPPLRGFASDRELSGAFIATRDRGFHQKRAWEDAIMASTTPPDTGSKTQG